MGMVIMLSLANIDVGPMYPYDNEILYIYKNQIATMSAVNRYVKQISE